MQQPRKKQKTELPKDLKKTDKTLVAVTSDATAKASKDGETMFSVRYYFIAYQKEHEIKS